MSNPPNSRPQPAPLNGATLAIFGACCVVSQVVILACILVDPKLGSQLFLTVLMALVALALATFRSRWLPIYIASVWVFEPEVRRLVDYSLLHYTAVPILSAAPLACNLTLLIPVMENWKKLPAQVKRAMTWFMIAFGYALTIGLVKNGGAAIYDCISNVVALLFVPYMASRRFDLADRRLWATSFVVLGVIVALYGWYQYITAPPWDMFWLKWSGMTGSMGSPLPLQFRMFSTMNSTQPAAALLGTSLTVALVNKNWRVYTSWFGVFLMATGLAITEVRSTWITFVVGVVAYFVFSSKKNRGQALIGISILVVGFMVVLPYLPGSEKVVERSSTFSDLNNDNSVNSRRALVTQTLPGLLSNPFGAGFGSDGSGAKLQGSTTNGGFDNGYLALIETFGLLGFACYMFASGIIIKYIYLSKKTAESQPYFALSLSAVASTAVVLVGFDVMGGVLGILVWFMVALPLGTTAQKPATAPEPRHVSSADPIEALSG